MQIRTTLTADQLTSICMRTDGMSDVDYFTHVLTALWKAVGGDDIFTREEKIACTAYAIPKRQWLHISGWLIERTSIDNRVQASMWFVNIAPSAFDEE